MIRIAAMMAVLGFGAEAMAQEAGGMHHAHGDMPPHLQAMMGAMDAMMAQMAIRSTGDVDADFLLLMIPHHQSAVDMARIVLEQGDDPEVRALAEAIIAAQEQEIAEMRAMLGRMGVELPSGGHE
ncbi:Uncharacterized protein putative in bacteria [Rubellimicrobium thermophilum DSM 16684]|uniref:Uncharacterized protein putative in bacteria n=1 Tax=Rubellimicrobium thermophilum DSM 16684 TaxID=1123069 RepID=S9QYE7_9RHOB|nr:DUF305 domain-containing protein [Rubellimicrobium thermophilum]EPX84648.1 Uncharacterized protein putative in bacteria [Rubellimicrobium thermophilum DSM 16684]